LIDLIRSLLSPAASIFLCISLPIKYPRLIKECQGGILFFMPGGAGYHAGGEFSRGWEQCSHGY
jgi:hypothetical protein